MSNRQIFQPQTRSLSNQNKQPIQQQSVNHYKSPFDVQQSLHPQPNQFVQKSIHQPMNQYQSNNPGYSSNPQQVQHNHQPYPMNIQQSQHQSQIQPQHQRVDSKALNDKLAQTQHVVRNPTTHSQINQKIDYNVINNESNFNYQHIINPSSQNTQQLNKVHCPKHQQTFTNICIQSNCLEPLCPDCIEEHLEIHQHMQTSPQIRNISTVRNDCLSFLKNIQSLYYKQSQHLSQFQNENISQNIAIQQQKIVNARNYLVSQIDKYFDQLQQQIQQELTHHSQQKPQEIKILQAKLSAIQQQLMKKEEKIRDNNDYTKTLLKMLYNDSRNIYNENRFNIQKELEELERGFHAVVVEHQDDVYQQMTPILSQYAKIDDATKLIQQDQENIRIIKNHNYNYQKNPQNYNYNEILNKFNMNQNLPQHFKPNFDPLHQQNDNYRHNLDHLKIQMDDYNHENPTNQTRRKV